MSGSGDKSQFNVYLPANLIREIKHAAIDDLAPSLSEYVEHAMRAHLDQRREKSLELFPVIFVRDIDRICDFLASLGLEFHETDRSRNGAWLALRVGEANLGLHLAKDPDGDETGAVIGFETLVPLERLVERLGRAGIEVDEPIIDETFGRSMVVRGPDGADFYITERDPELMEHRARE